MKVAEVNYLNLLRAVVGQISFPGHYSVPAILRSSHGEPVTLAQPFFFCQGAWDPDFSQTVLAEKWQTSKAKVACHNTDQPCWPCCGSFAVCVIFTSQSAIDGLQWWEAEASAIRSHRRLTGCQTKYSRQLSTYSLNRTLGHTGASIELL
jgi:hypothetical protein